MSEPTPTKKRSKKGTSASIDIADVQPAFDKLKEHCEKEAPWARHTNADIVRFAIFNAAENLDAKK